MPEQRERAVRRGARARTDGRVRRSPLARVLPFAIAAAFGATVGVVILAVWLFVRGDEEADRGPAAAPRAASIEELRAFASEARHPVYWAGPQPRFTYELSETRDGRVYIHYVPRGAEVGDDRPDYLAVGTYPQEEAFETLQETARAQGVTTIELAGGGLAFQDANRPTSVYLAYPGSNYQVEVYAPDPAAARAIVESGQIKPLGAPTPTPTASKAASVNDLERLAADLGHAVYWAGPERDTTYELTRTSDGSVYVRYLPPEVGVGVRRPYYLTIATYPQEDALAVLARTAAENDVETIEVPNGGRAFVEEENRTSVWLAFPAEDVQIEVYDPSPERALELVTSGRIAPIR